MGGIIADAILKAAQNAIPDGQFLSDVGTNAKALMLMPEAAPYGVGNVPSEDALSKMPWSDLLQLRSKLTTKAEQNAVAPYEHRAYAREYSPDTYSAVQNAVGSLGYTAAKPIIGGARSDPSLREIGQGLLGAWEGWSK